MKDKVGIVIVSYNASVAVRATLASLRQARNHTSYELLLIDNASKKEEREEISRAFKRHTSEDSLPWKLIRLTKNLGFSGGNNVGIKKFLKDPFITHVCLLNSDVIVGDYWLDRLVEKKVEIVSAVTNKADSEQCVPTTYNLELGDCIDVVTDTVPAPAFNTINSFSQSWYSAWKDNIVISDVTFFCVLLTTGLVKNIGLLDETFFPGGYEDNDYCERVKAAGIPIWLARDVFIQHFGSASFGQLERQYFSTKASKNKSYAEKKHNIIIRKQHEKPLISYLQDIAYALQGKGNSGLQAVYNQLYIETLTRLINHSETEFTAIYSHLVACTHPVPDDLKALTDAAAQSGNVMDEWQAILVEVGKGLKYSLPQQEIADLQLRIKRLAEAVYTKAESNFRMVGFLQEIGVFSTGHPPETKNYGIKLKWFLKKGLPFFLNLKGIVFFGGYPYKEREKDGYFQRIRSIDNLFPDRWRVYVDHMKVEGKDGWYDKPEPNVLVLHVPNHKHRWFMRLLVALCVIRCRTIYFHSVLRMSDSNFGSFMRWPGVKKVIDIHGVVPEEFRYHNDFFSAGLYDNCEKLAVRKADYVIVVTHAMHHYLMQKYRADLKAKVIALPIFPSFNTLRTDKAYVNGKPIVVYAGGTHKWQQVPKMIMAINLTRDDCWHEFYCPDPGEVLAMMPESLRNDSRVLVASKPFNELLVAYERCHFGFVLREDIVVNHVACPTKLIEYIAMGIVPIVECDKMGDFKAFGMQYLHLKDFTEGQIPSESERNRMAQANFDIFIKLQEMNLKGRSFLQENLSLADGSLIKKGIKKSAALAFPKDTSRGIWVRNTLGRGHTNPIIIPQPDLPIEETGGSEAPLPDTIFLPECDVLVQVGNFLVGGLENVVLDLNETLINSGLKVGILVLGEAGKAVEKAKSMGTPVCITPYNEKTYKALLKMAQPKVVMAHYSITGLSFCSNLNIPVIQVIHNIYMWFSSEEASAFAKSAKYTSVFIAVSENAKEYSLKRLGLPPEKCITIPNGIDISRFRNSGHQNDRNSFRSKYGLTPDDFVFLNVGSITHQKNHISTIRAFHTVLKYCPNAKLVILGKVYEWELWKQVEEYIVANQLQEYITHVKESTNAPAFYAMADAFVHSAFFEGGPLTLLEAVVSNLPVVITDSGFAKHFRGVKGIALIPTPIDITEYRGQIWQLTPTDESVRNLAIEMLNIYAQRVRPDLEDAVIDKLNKNDGYLMYITIIKELITDTGWSPLNMLTDSWTSYVEQHKEVSVSELSI